MRLIKDEGHGNFSLVEHNNDSIPRYAILSHTWGMDAEEVTFKDLIEGTGKNKAGRKKIEFCRKQAASDDIQHFWVDTCCIDKSSSAELTEAINSMFRWYRNATKCYVYLSDVLINDCNQNGRPLQSWEAAFRNSRWFTRGWTLQELIAPQMAEFFSLEGERLGDKRSLRRQIHEITGIAVRVLEGNVLSEIDVSERMSWAEKRETKRGEDKAYSLLGLFDVHIPLIYGEGEENALRRLREAIDSRLFPRKISTISPSAVIPFRRDRDFVERPVLSDILQRTAEPGARIGLVGLGGVGKSQLAIEYAYRVRETHPQTWVFWVHASSAIRFEESYRNIAERLQLTGWNELTVDVLALVQGWLSDESHGRWTMLVDNADVADVLFEPSNRGTNTNLTAASTVHTLSEFLPSSPNGSIVITSRSREVLEGLVEYHDDILEVKPMEVDKGVVLLTKKLKKPQQDFVPEELIHLVKQLDCMPLAITQAAAYINQRAPRMTVSMYVGALEHDDGERMKLLLKDIRDPRRDGQASNSIITTWHVSFRHLRQKHDSASRLLALMSLFDREAIPDHLLQGEYLQSLRGENSFEDDIAILKAYSLIGINMNGTLFDMHRLVQLATKSWLEVYGQLTEWQERFVSILGDAFPRGVYANWPTCRALFPHVEAMSWYHVKDVDQRKVWATVLYNGTWYANETGQYEVAEKMARASLEVREGIFSHNHTVTFSSYHILGEALRFQGKYEQAEEMNRKALVGYEKALGVDHPHTLTSVSNLALVLQHQGKYEQAEEMSRRALAGCEKALGVDHPHTLTSVSNLALVLQHQGKYEQVEEMNRRALAGWEKALGLDHPHTLTSVSNLASVLADQGKYEQAEEMSRRVLAGYDKALGMDHPHTLTSVSNLASLLQHQGKYEQAEEMSRRALSGREKALGVDHPHTLTSVSNLASVLADQGKYEQAEEMSRRALSGREKALGVDHPKTLTSVNNLASVLQHQGKYEQAEEMIRRALAGYEKALGVDHPHTLASVSNLALVLQHQGKYEQVEEMSRRALSGREKALGVDHPDTLTSVNNLASVLQHQGKYEQAEEMSRRALSGREKALGVDHPKTLTSVNNLALVLQHQGKYEQAEEMIRRALAGREKALGMDHPHTLASVSNLALVLQHQGKYEQVEEMNRRALVGREKAMDMDHSDMLTSIY